MAGDAAAEVVPESRVLFVVPFAAQQLDVAIRMLVEEQRILHEESGPFFTGLPGFTTQCGRVEYADISCEGYPSIREGPPGEVGVLTKMGLVEALVETAEAIHHIPANEEIGSHEAEPLEADVRHETIANIVRLVAFDEPLYADDIRVAEVALRSFEPIIGG
jgi:hypothetical protein